MTFMGKSKSTTSRASASSASAATPTRRRRSCEEEDSTRKKDSSRRGGRNNGAGVAQAATVEVRGDTGHHGGDDSHDHHDDYDSVDGDVDDAGGTNTATSSTSATTSWNCHTCTFLNKNVHRQDCSFCGAVRKGDGTMSMSGNDNGEEFMLDGSIHSNEVLVDDNNNILRRDATKKKSESQSSTTAEQKNRRPSGSSRLMLHSNNNKSSPSARRDKGGGDDRNDDHKNNDDDGTGSDDPIINASDVDSIRLIDSVSKSSVASSRRAGRRGTVPADDSSTMMHHSKISPRHHHQSDENIKFRRRNTIDGGRGGGAGGEEGRSNSEQNIDQEEQQIGRNKNKIWTKEEDLNDEGKQPRSGSDDYDDDSDPKSSSSSSAGSGSITKSGINTAKKLLIPEGRVTIVYTDVQGSTSLWEADPYSMKKATDIHDSIIRKCYSEHGGYEISTEGDSFNLAFQHPADAIGFALRAQLLLHRARWPMALLHRPEMCENEKLKFRGFRVRMGMHHGPTTLRVHETTGRTIYQGEAVNVAKAIEKMCHGGQILTTVETWRSLSGMAEKFLGSPQVLDCGEHVLFDPKKIMKMNGSGGGTSSSTKRNAKTKQRVVSKRIVQLVPNSLSYDFFAARSWQEENHPPVRVCGRVFPPLLSHGQLSTSFFNAPYVGNRVAMVFVYTHKMDKVTDRERKKNYKILAQYVRSHLMRLYPPGYECQEQKGSWMLAFDRIENGIKFGLDLKEDVIKNSKLNGDINKEITFRIGIVWGPFLSMGPHTVSGHADYFGPIGEIFICCLLLLESSC